MHDGARSISDCAAVDSNSKILHFVALTHFKFANWRLFNPAAKVQTFASGTEYPSASGQWLPRFPPRERNADEQFRSIAEIAPAAARPRGWVAHHGFDLHSRD